MVWIKNISGQSQASLFRLIAVALFVLIYLSLYPVFNTNSSVTWANIICAVVLSSGAVFAVIYKRTAIKILVIAGLTYVVTAACVWIAKPDTMQGWLQLKSRINFLISLYWLSSLLIILSIILMVLRASSWGQSLLRTSLQPLHFSKTCINLKYSVCKNENFVLNSSHYSGSNSNKRNSDFAGTETDGTASLFRFNSVFFFYLTVFIEGAALMVVELLGAKLLASFYGSSLYVWTAVLSITVLGLSFGYYLGGRFSRKPALLKTITLSVGGAALWVGMMPWIAKAVIAITSTLDLVPGISIASLLLIVPPMVAFGTVGPIAVRFLTASVETSGNSSGSVYFISTLGGILATFLFGYFAIPYWGIKACALVTGIALAIIPAWYILFFPKDNEFSLHEITIPSQGKQLNKNTSVKPSPITPSTFYLFAALEGASVMAVELIAARMLAPYFGGSLGVWATVLGITLFSLAAGYFTGGKWADTSSGTSSVKWAVLWSALSILGMHLVASRLTWVLADWELNAALIMMAFLLLFPPLFFLGMVPTLLIRKITQLTDETGMVTGKVFALSAASGILILPVLGFWIIPHFGLTHPSLFLGLLIGGIALAGLLKEKKYLALVLIPVALFSFSKREVFGQSKNVRVLEFSEGLLGQVLVADVFVNGKGQPINDRMLFVNRMGQTVMNNQTGNSQYLYITFASAAASVLPEGSKALLLGLGGGSMANALDNLKFEVDAVELDPRIAKVAQNYFGLSKGINVVVDDARHYLETTEKKYDLVFFDVFKGDVLPGQVLSKEAFERANALLNPGGLMIVNLNGFITGEIGKPGRSIFQTLQAADLEVNLLPTPGEEENRNNLFIASKGIKDFSTLRLPLLFKGQPVSLSTVFESVKKFNGDQMYTDDKNSLERDNLPAASKWRRDYNTGFVPFLENNQVPLFK